MVSIFLIAVFAITLLSDVLTIQNRGTVAFLGLKGFIDSNGTTEITEINWKRMELGESRDFQLYVKLNGTLPATLTLNVTTFDPSISEQYLTLSWNYIADTIIQPKVMVPITLTLNLAGNATNFTNFAFDILIEAEES